MVFFSVNGLEYSGIVMIKTDNCILLYTTLISITLCNSWCRIDKYNNPQGLRHGSLNFFRIRVTELCPVTYNQYCLEAMVHVILC